MRKLSDFRPCDTSIIPHVRTSFFFFNDTATTEIYTLSLHDALPILCCWAPARGGRHDRRPHQGWDGRRCRGGAAGRRARDRKSTRLNSSHSQISYAVFCLNKKTMNTISGPYSDSRRVLHCQTC